MKIRLLTFLQALVPASFFYGCTPGLPGRSMGGWGHMMGYGGHGGTFMWLILIIIAGVVVYFVLERNKKTRRLEDTTRESPMEILKRRYAKGDITREEFERLKKDIES